MYAIIDIETTGGKYNEEGITEIAIYKFDGEQIIDEFVSLINPQQPIQPFVVQLTGINSSMLTNAPKFHEVARRIIEITEDCIIVAHNAQFDNRILSLEFDRLGYDYSKKSVCTVELSKTLLPGHESYSLGKLVKSLGILITDRHRASGDALATVQLFKLLLAKDTHNTVINESAKIITKKSVPKKLKNILETVPSTTGVYYMHNANDTIIYIGKSKNIRKRIRQHFTNENKKSKELQKAVTYITFKETGSELVALLEENQAIKLLKPRYNRVLRKTKFSTQVVAVRDNHGYLNLKIEKADPLFKAITTFTNRTAAKKNLEGATETYKLCLSKVGTLSSTSNSPCFNYGIKKCYGACVLKEDSTDYNKRVQSFINKHSYENKNMLIIDRGRSSNENSLVLIENGAFTGTGFLDKNSTLSIAEIKDSIISTMENNRDAQHIIQSYLRHKKVKQIKLF